MRSGKVFIPVMVLFLVFAFSVSGLAQEKRFDVPAGDSPSSGPANAPVTIIEFLDYQ